MTVKSRTNCIQSGKSTVSPSLNNPSDKGNESIPVHAQDVFDLAACMLVVLAKDQSVVRINKRGCDILGYEAGEMIGLNWFDIVLAEEYREGAREAFIRFVEGDILAAEYYENLNLTKAGQERLICWHNTLIRNARGHIVGLIGSGEDVTEQRKVESALCESERSAFALLNATFDAVFLVDASSRIILAANEQFARRFNTTVDKVRSHSIEEFVIPDLFPERYARAFQVLETGEPLMFIDQRDKIWLEHHYYPIKDDQGRVIRLAIFSKDITARYLAEQILREREAELHRRTVELEEANTALKVVLKNFEDEKRSLGDTITTNLHDIVLPYIDMLKKERGSDWQVKCLDTLETNLKNILSPFIKEMSWRHENLTPAELQVANLIREGKSAKEIATLLHVSVGTINTHCHNIRKKMGLNHGKVSLRLYLRTVSL